MKSISRSKSTLLFILHREIALLLVLAGISVLLFLVTRSVAARNRAMSLEVATAWYTKGQEQLRARNIDGAIDSFRKAATNNHDNPQYVLALATSLASSDRVDEARQSLLQLRMSAPESGEINLQLARLSARDGLKPEAVRYYHNALYGVWSPDENATQRRDIRAELIRFLLQSGDTQRALSELLILSSDIPDREQAHNGVGQMLLQAGAWQLALEQFQRSLHLNGKNADALQGAGYAAFNLRDYKKANDYLDAAVSSGRTDEETANLLTVGKLVLSLDPLVPRLMPEERIRRLTVALQSAEEALQACAATIQDSENSNALKGLLTELTEDLKTRYSASNLRRDADGFQTGLNLIYRIGMQDAQWCHESSPMHRALMLIAQKNGVAE